jgi:hypothetical protein
MILKFYKNFYWFMRTLTWKTAYYSTLSTFMPTGLYNWKSEKPIFLKRSYQSLPILLLNYNFLNIILHIFPTIGIEIEIEYILLR